MNKRYQVLSAIVVALACCLAWGCMKGGTSPEVGRTAPDFTLKDLSGNDVRLSDLKGTVVLLNFWATWCPPCREEAPSLSRLNSRMAGPGFRMLAVAVDAGGAKAVEAFFGQARVRLPALTDPTGETARRYGTTGVPETFIIDKKGVIRKKIVGPIAWDDPGVVGYLEDLRKR